MKGGVCIQVGMFYSVCESTCEEISEMATCLSFLWGKVGSWPCFSTCRSSLTRELSTNFPHLDRYHKLPTPPRLPGGWGGGGV